MSKHHDAIQALRQKLMGALESQDVTLTDESHLHVGHASYHAQKVHLALTASSKHFNALSEVDKQRMIYHILKDDMTVFIHALRFEKLSSL